MQNTEIKNVLRGSRAVKRGRFRAEVKKNYLLFVMLLPACAYFFVFHYLPMAGIVLAFEDYNYFGGIFGSPWVGFDNFRFLFISGTIWRITFNTIAYNLAFILIGAVLQVGTAVMLNEIGVRWYKRLTQSLLFLPHFVSFVLLAAFVYNLFTYEHGTLNSFLRAIGQKPLDMYNTPSAWAYVLLFFYQWKSLGYGTVIYLAAITGINPELYEAARIDGASRLQEIRHITLPALKPTAIVVVLFAIGGIMRGQFQLFYQIIGDNGHLFAATDIIDTFVFRMLTTNFDIGMGAAAGLYQSFFGLAIILAVNYIVKRNNPEYALF